MSNQYCSATLQNPTFLEHIICPEYDPKLFNKEANITHAQEKRQSIETDPEMMQILELASKEFKATLNIMLQDVKESAHNEESTKKYRREVQTRKKPN